MRRAVEDDQGDGLGEVAEEVWDFDGVVLADLSEGHAVAEGCRRVVKVGWSKVQTFRREESCNEVVEVVEGAVVLPREVWLYMDMMVDES